METGTTRGYADTVPNGTRSAIISSGRLSMRRPLALACALFAAAICLCLSIWVPEGNRYLALRGETVTLSGTVTSKEYKRSDDGSLKLLVTIKDVSFASRNDGCSDPDFSVLLRVPASEEAAQLTPIGSRILSSGKLRCYSPATNEGGFDALSYYRSLGLGDFSLSGARILASDGKQAVLLDGLCRLRQRLAGVLDACLSEESAAVMKAMLLGEKGFLAQSTKDLYQGGGIIHVLAISGLHISFLGMSFYRLLRKKLGCGRILSCLLSCLLILLYCLMTGFSVSAFRAVFMFCLHMAALLLHRTYDVVTAVTLTGALLLVSEPYLFCQSGFQFSFAAVLSLALLMPVFPPEGHKPDLFDRTGQLLCVSAGTFPVYLCTYGYWPWVSLVLNPIILPLMSVLLPAGLLVLLLGSFSLPLGKIFGLLPETLLVFTRILCTLAKKIPGHLWIPGAPAGWMVALFYALLGILILAKDHLPSPARLFWLLGCILLLLVRSPAGCNVKVADVGQGDGILLEAGGSVIMVDGGSTTKSDVARYQLEPLLCHDGAGVIDLWVLTHDDTDHCSGLIAMLEDGGQNGIRIQRIALPDIADETKAENYRTIEKDAEAAGIPITYLHAGMEISAGKLSLYCLHPEAEFSCDDPNQYSTTLLLHYGNYSALLTGDLEDVGETAMLDYLDRHRAEVEACGGQFDSEGRLHVTLLKVAHHGSSGATSEDFLQRVTADVGVISCGVDNEYGHPHRATLQRLQDAGIPWYDTRYSGEVIFHTDGKKLSIREIGGELNRIRAADIVNETTR